MQNSASECQIHELFHLQVLVPRRIRDKRIEVQIVLDIITHETGMGTEELLKQPAVLVNEIQRVLCVRQI